MMSSPPDHLAHGGVDLRVVVAQNQRPEGGVVIQVARAVGVGEIRAGSLDHRQRPGQAPVAGIDTAGDHALGARGQVGVPLRSRHR